MTYSAPFGVARGDVVASDGRFAVVLYLDQGTPVLAAITANNSVRRRSDVVVDSIDDMIAMGCAGRSIKIRTASRVHMAGVRVGRVPERLMQQVMRVAAREIEATRHEAKWTVGGLALAGM